MPECRTPETLTIVGASVRAAAQSALRGGYAVVAADLFADRDLAQLCPTTQVDDYPLEFDAVISASQSGGWLYTGGLENYSQLIDAWAERRPLYGVRGEALRNVRRPELVAEALRAARLPAPEVALTAARLSREKIWLQKPLSSSGGIGVRRWTESNGVDTTAQSGDCYYQEFISGQNCSAVYVACQGESRLLGMSSQLVGPDWLGCGGFRYAGSIGPWPLTSTLRSTFELLGSTLARSFRLTGLFGVDAVLRGDEAWTVEVNPRYPASVEVLERAGDFSAVELHVAACRYGRLPPSAAMPDPCVHGKAILFAKRPLVIPLALATEWLELAQQPTQTMADVPAPGTKIPANAPIVTLLATGASESEVLGRLQAEARRRLATLDRG
jgi:predicted ATP-grasp superfamily ATP-dependent carboligase